MTVGGDMTLSGSSPVQLLLDEVHVDIYTGRKAVDDTTDSRSMTLSKRCQSKNPSKCIHLHVFTFQSVITSL